MNVQKIDLSDFLSDFRADFSPFMALVTGECADISATKRIRVEHSNGINAGQPLLRVQKLTENAYLPTRGSNEAAGYDLYR